MTWTDRQQALLREMGIHLWPGAGRSAEARPEQAPSMAAESPDADAASANAPITAVQRPTALPPANGSVPPVQSASGHQPGTITRLGSASTMDWPTLRQAVQKCRACGLCESRTQTVFGVGNTSARWMLVGEAPGEQEDLQGEPFVGKAGQLLDAMLRSVGLTRSEAPPEQQVYIANVLKCRPPHNRNPQPEEVARCEPFLVRQVELVQPRLILAMGRFAVQSLLQTQEPIGRLRGKLHRYQGVPVVVTYHPAYLLRNPLDKARSWEDLCLARSVLMGDSPR